MAKSTGLGAALIKNRNRLGNVVVAMLSGRFVRHLPRKSPSEVDLLIVGDITQPELVSLVRAEEARREQTINYTPMTLEEIRFRRTRHDPFLADILVQSRVLIIGDEQDLVG